MLIHPTRRQALGALAVGAISPRLRGAAADPWAEMEAVRKRIQPPRFPERDFDITRYGAREKGDASAAIRQAIDACAAAGGGRVVVPAGVWQTGAIHLKSRVNLYLPAGATLRFSRGPKAYLPLVESRWEGMELMNYASFLYANGQRDIAVTGAGTLDGAADREHWWPWKGRTEFGWKKGDPSQQKARDALQQMAERDVPLADRRFGEGSYLRPMFIQPVRCQNVLIEGVTILNSPMWEITPLLCRNVTVKDVRIDSHGPNNDGCDPESSADVLIEGCIFDTGDDCIAIKSGRNRDGRRINVPAENIIVRQCQMKDGHGGVTLGSECSGGIRNIWAEDCRMDSPQLDRVLRIKTNSVRGGTIERVYMRNIEAGQVAGAAIDVDFTYEEGDKGQFPPTVRDIEVTNLKVRQSGGVLYLRGYASSPIRNVRLEGCTFEQAAKPNRVEHVEGLVMQDVTINGKRV